MSDAINMNPNGGGIERTYTESEALAAVAAAYEAAAQAIEAQKSSFERMRLAAHIRTLATAPQVAALEKVKAEARADSEARLADWQKKPEQYIGLHIVGEMLRQIPSENAQGWNRYDTDNEHVLHVWSGGKSYDVRVPKEEFLHGAPSLLRESEAEAKRLREGLTLALELCNELPVPLHARQMDKLCKARKALSAPVPDGAAKGDGDAHST